MLKTFLCHTLQKLNPCKPDSFDKPYAVVYQVAMKKAIAPSTLSVYVVGVEPVDAVVSCAHVMPGFGYLRPAGDTPFALVTFPNPSIECLLRQLDVTAQ